MECLSGMKGNFHVPFLEEGERVIALPYSELQETNKTNMRGKMEWD